MKYVDPTGYVTSNGQYSQEEGMALASGGKAHTPSGAYVNVYGHGTEFVADSYKDGNQARTLNNTYSDNGLPAQKNNPGTTPGSTPQGPSGNITDLMNGNNVSYRSVIDAFSPTYNYEQIGNSLHFTPKDNLYSRFDNGDYLGALYSFFFDNLPGFDGFWYDIDTGKISTVQIGVVPNIGLKPINLPAWKSISIDMEHILSGHVPGGSRVSSLKTLFQNMNEKQIESTIRQAYRNSSKLATQAGRVLVVGKAGGYTIQMWVNLAKKAIETAFPLY